MTEDQKVVDYLAVMLAEKNNIIKELVNQTNQYIDRARIFEEKCNKQEEIISEYEAKLKEADERYAELLNKKGGKNNG